MKINQEAIIKAVTKAIGMPEERRDVKIIIPDQEKFPGMVKIILPSMEVVCIPELQHLSRELYKRDADIKSIIVSADEEYRLRIIVNARGFKAKYHEDKNREENYQGELD